MQDPTIIGSFFYKVSNELREIFSIISKNELVSKNYTKTIYIGSK
jgi:hypothetical protein